MFNFMKWRYLYFVLSALVLVPGLISLLLFGLRPAIDFTGGTLLEIRQVNPTAENAITTTVLPAEVTSIFPDARVQVSGENQVIVRGRTLDEATRTTLLDTLNTAYGEFEVLRFETVGPIIGRELVIKTIVAIALAATIITLYITRQFHQLRFGVSAILAVIHDIFIMLGVFSLLGRFAGVEVDVLFVTALLTTLSFSVHDTIVVFDRIRELQANNPRLSLREVINASVLQTLSRSLNNSITIIIMLLALVLLGGDTVRWFAVALLVGAITGTYSSTFTAAPLLLVCAEWRNKQKRKLN